MTQNIALTSRLPRAEKAPGWDGVTLHADSTMTPSTRPRLPFPSCLSGPGSASPSQVERATGMRWSLFILQNIHEIFYCYAFICHLVCILAVAFRVDAAREFDGWTPSEYRRAILVSGKLSCNSESGHRGRRSARTVPWQDEEFWGSQVRRLCS